MLTRELIPLLADDAERAFEECFQRLESGELRARRRRMAAATGRASDQTALGLLPRYPRELSAGRGSTGGAAGVPVGSLVRIAVLQVGSVTAGAGLSVEIAGSVL
jgi:hypothetical protein